jgi:outer membrane protein assembly factor BamB
MQLVIFFISRLVSKKYPEVLSAALALISLTGVQAADWPEFRGPTGQGLASDTGLPVSLDPAHDFTWRQSIPGKGWSSPIVCGDWVFLTTAVASENDGTGEQSLRALCLSAATGAALWDVEVFARQGGAGIHMKNSFASPTPITDGQRLYVHFGPDGTAALDLDGHLIWANREIRYDPRHGAGGSPIFAGPLLVFNCDGADDPQVVALRRDTGEVQWRAPRPATESQRFSFATPLEIEVGGHKQVVSPASHVVCGYDPETGSEIWRVWYPNKWSIIPRPVYAHGLVFVCTGYEGPAELLAIRPDGQGDVTETHVTWRTDENVSHSPSPLVVGDELFMISDNGIASCRDARTGRLHWRQRLGGNHSVSPLCADGKIYFASEQGQCTVIEASRVYRELARCDFGEPTLASFAVADGALFVRTESQLYRFD